MKREELEKYISELSPELQEKARACQTTEELTELAAQNDVELSEDALQAVSGGCGSDLKRGDPVEGKFCPDCGSQLYFFSQSDCPLLYCDNSGCKMYVNSPSAYCSSGTAYNVWRDHGTYLESSSCVVVKQG